MSPRLAGVLCIPGLLVAYAGFSNTAPEPTTVPQDEVSLQEFSEATRTTLSVWIDGDDTVAPYEVCAWVARVSGGTPPYTYNWWGGLSGSNFFLEGWLPQSSWEWVEVIDADQQADTAAILIHVDESYSCDYK